MDTLITNLAEQVTSYSPRITGAIVVFAGFWIAGILSKRILIRLAKDSDSGRQDVVRLLAQGTKILLLLVGLISAFGTLGIDVTAMVAGLGLTGFALGFALKDILANIIAGILILLYRPFQRGDRILTSGFEGEVAAINMRYTTIASEKGMVLVPNSVLFTQSITVLEDEQAS